MTVQAHPKVDQASLAVVHQAIADWDAALRQEFGGLITLTDVTGPPQYLYYVTMHELGHALGLGHALPLSESTDLMGYGWHWSNGIVPTLSECDLEGIETVLARLPSGRPLRRVAARARRFEFTP